MQLLRRMQTLLAQLYDAPVREDVQDFVLSDRRALSEAVGEQAGEGADEQVFVVEDEQGVRLGLFIESGVLDRLARRDPLQALDEDNLADFCTALEGVSHFHYLVWSLARGRNVSLLELELQAEVDKYATALALMTRQRAGCFPGSLHARMFHAVSFLPQLDDISRRATRRRTGTQRGTAARWRNDFCARGVSARSCGSQSCGGFSAGDTRKKSDSWRCSAAGRPRPARPAPRAIRASMRSRLQPDTTFTLPVRPAWPCASLPSTSTACAGRASSSALCGRAGRFRTGCSRRAALSDSSGSARSQDASSSTIARPGFASALLRARSPASPSSFRLPSHS